MIEVEGNISEEIYSPTDELIKKIWHISTMESYSIIEKNEKMPLAATWIDLEIIIMSEVREGQRKTNIIVIQSLSCV